MKNTYIIEILLYYLSVKHNKAQAHIFNLNKKILPHYKLALICN